jgi:hypothetical protein
VSGVSGRQGTIAFAVQTAKGTPGHRSGRQVQALGRSVAHADEDARPVQHDRQGSGSRPGVHVALGVAGDVPVYLHPDGAAFLFAAVMGQAVDSGTNPNYTHVETYADDMLWLTVWREVGGVIVEKFVDCKIHALKLSGRPGSRSQVTLSVIGLNGAPLGAGAELTALQGLALPRRATSTRRPTARSSSVASRRRSIRSTSRSTGRVGVPGRRLRRVGRRPGRPRRRRSFATRFQSGAVGVTDYYTFFYGPSARRRRRSTRPRDAGVRGHVRS